ncbi:MAG: SH3 domain-containing protein [Pyrinomonadaceae bacterium]
MKRCPQCNSVYGNDVHFCLNDGTPLIEETFSLPSEDFESETVIRHDPIVVDLSAESIPPEQVIYQNPPTETVIIEKPAKSKSSAVFLVVGLLLGGSLVLATLLLARNFYQNDNSNTVKINQVTETNSNKSVKVSPTETSHNINKLSQKHEARTSADDEEFNGRVIALNAYVRVTPGRSSDEIDVLPVDDRINIDRRENEESPWYYVICEHGTSGWMHGNTIEFTR